MNFRKELKELYHELNDEPVLEHSYHPKQSEQSFHSSQNSKKTNRRNSQISQIIDLNMDQEGERPSSKTHLFYQNNSPTLSAKNLKSNNFGFLDITPSYYSPSNLKRYAPKKMELDDMNPEPEVIYLLFIFLEKKITLLI